MKKIITTFASLLAALFVVMPCSALSGAVSGYYAYDDEAIDGVEVKLYKVATYGESGYLFEPEYAEHEQDIITMTNSELGEYGEELAAVEAEPLITTQTIDGVYSFSGFEEGIYLVVFEDKTIGDYTYTALPIVLTMPDVDRNYSIHLTTKLEKSCPDCVEPEPEPTPPPENPDQPYTRDKIQRYIIILAVLICVEVLMLYVIINTKKEKDSNDQK